MRRILVALTMTGALLAATGCTPTTTVTANPSTTKPACKAITGRDAGFLGLNAKKPPPRRVAASRGWQGL